MSVDAQLKIQNQAGELVGLIHADDTSSPTGRAAPTADFDARSKLEAVRALLAGTLTVDLGGGVDLATEATLEAVRARTVALEALTTELRDNQLRRTDPVDISGQSVLTSSAMSPLNDAGQVFVAGKRVTVGGALSTARAVLAVRNPVGSGVNVNIFALVIYTSVAQWFRYAEDPNLDSPTNHGATAKSFNRANPGTSTLELITDTVAPTVADYWDAETRVTANAPVPLQFPVPVKIPPGETFAVVGDSSNAQDTGINAYFFQTAV